MMSEGTKRFLIAGFIFLFAIWGVTGGFTWLASFMPSGQVQPMQAQPGQPCVTATGASGVMQWSEIAQRAICVAKPVTPGAPVTTLPSGPTGQAVPLNSLTCAASDDLASFMAEVHDSLDYEAQGSTLLSGVTIYLVKGGMRVDKQTSSSSDAVELSVQCPPTTQNAKVGFIALDDDNSGDDIYPVDTVQLTYPFGKLGGQTITYSGENVPIWADTSSVGPKGLVDAPVAIPAEIQGNLSITVWDSTGTVSDKNLSLATDPGTVNSYAKFLIKELSKDEAAQGLTLLIDYNTKNISDIYPSLSSGSFVEDKGVIPSYDSEYDTAFRLYSDANAKEPLKLDGSKLTPAVPNEFTGGLAIERKTTATGGENITLKVIDTMRYLKPGSYTWEGNGALYAEDSNNNNLGIQADDEPSTDLILQYS